MNHAHARSQPGTAGPPRPAVSPAPGGLPGPARGAEDSDLQDLRLYERLIGEGIAAAGARGGAVDHVTARRLAIWLAVHGHSR